MAFATANRRSTQVFALPAGNLAVLMQSHEPGKPQTPQPITSQGRLAHFPCGETPTIALSGFQQACLLGPNASGSHVRIVGIVIEIYIAVCGLLYRLYQLQGLDVCSKATTVRHSSQKMVAGTTARGQHPWHDM
jgi:hypothetical protein